MRQITTFLFVLSGEKKETPERKPGRLEGSMRPGSAGKRNRPGMIQMEGGGVPILTAEHGLNCTHELSSDGEDRSIVLTSKEPSRSTKGHE